MTGPVERPWWRGGGKGLMLGGLGLAVVAVAALALGAEDTRLLRLGIIAALWAALLGTFAAARTRREVGSSADRAEELRTVYQLELEREIAARREHELTVERELREQFAKRQRAEIAALHAELQSLRGTLQNLLGGDVLVERVALRESTRLRPLPDHTRTIPAVDSRDSLESRESTSRDSLGRVPRGLTVSSEWPVDEVEDSVTGDWTTVSRTAETDRTAGSTQSRYPWRAESEPPSDSDLLGRAWSPAVNWTPSVEPPTGAGHRARWRRAAADPSEPESRTGPVPGYGPAPAARHAGTGHDPWGQADPPGQAPETNGRHGRAGEPSWMSSGSNVGADTNSHTTGPRTQDQSVGAHRGGRSVQDLLAAYGENPTPRHRRRRKDD